MFWVVQSLGLVATICTLISFFQKEKWKTMICFATTNAILIAIFLLLGRLVGGLLCVGALLRTIVFFFFSKINKKPDPIIMILFDIYYIVVTIVFWDSAIDLLMLVNLILVTYTSYQTNISVMRFGYISSSLLLIPYDILVGAYTTILSEIAMLISVIFLLVKYTKVTKSYQNVANRYFFANKKFWGSNILEKESFDFVSSSVDKSMYYNFGIMKKENNFLKCISEIKEESKKKGVEPIAYLPFGPKFDQAESTAQTLSMFFPVKFQDVWMKLSMDLI